MSMVEATDGWSIEAVRGGRTHTVWVRLEPDPQLRDRSGRGRGEPDAAVPHQVVGREAVEVALDFRAYEGAGVDRTKEVPGTGRVMNAHGFWGKKEIYLGPVTIIKTNGRCNKAKTDTSK